jgi:hypothetical protein
VIATTIDPRMGVVLASSSMKNGSTSSTSVSFDALGRVTTDETDSCNYDCSDGSTTSIARTYDQDNHLLTTNVHSDTGVAANSSYDWGVSGHPIRIGGSCTTAQIPNCPANGTMGYETLHWDGDQLLFTTSANGLDDIKIGEIGDITPQDPTYKGLTFWDRDASQSVVYCHNASGAAGNGLPAYSSSGPRGITISHNPCQVRSGQSMTTPSSVLWTTNPEAKYNTYRIGWNAVLGMPRVDGFTDGFNTIQGVRVYDSTLGGWATPDAYQGDVHDPMSQKSYVWNRGNAVAYGDPSGYDTVYVNYFVACCYRGAFGVTVAWHTFITVVADDGKTVLATYSFGPKDGFLVKDYALTDRATLDPAHQVAVQRCTDRCSSEPGMKALYDRYKNNEPYKYLTHNSSTGTSGMLAAGGIHLDKAPDAPGWTPGWNGDSGLTIQQMIDQYIASDNQSLVENGGDMATGGSGFGVVYASGPGRPL